MSSKKIHLCCVGVVPARFSRSAVRAAAPLYRSTRRVCLELSLTLPLPWWTMTLRRRMNDVGLNGELGARLPTHVSASVSINLINKLPFVPRCTNTDGAACCHACSRLEARRRWCRCRCGRCNQRRYISSCRLRPCYLHRQLCTLFCRHRRPPSSTPPIHRLSYHRRRLSCLCHCGHSRLSSHSISCHRRLSCLCHCRLNCQQRLRQSSRQRSPLADRRLRSTTRPRRLRRGRSG